MDKLERLVVILTIFRSIHRSKRYLPVGRYKLFLRTPVLRVIQLQKKGVFQTPSSSLILIFFSHIGAKTTSERKPYGLSLLYSNLNF